VKDWVFTLFGDIGKDLKEPSYATSAAWGRGAVKDDYNGENRSPNKLFRNHVFEVGCCFCLLCKLHYASELWRLEERLDIDCVVL
jgi:hypothetical protein